MIVNESTGLEIAIIGLAGKFPMARNIDEFWSNLCQGKECISFFSEQELIDSGVDEEIVKKPTYIRAKGFVEDMEFFDANFFGYSPREATLMDPQIRILHECVWEALEDAGHVSNPDKIGLFAGSTTNYYGLGKLEEARNNFSEFYQIMTTNDKDFLCTRLAYKLNFRGPCVTVQTACSTSLVAVHLACQALIGGECDMAVSGGVSLMIPKKCGYLYQQGMILSNDGHCRAFDEKAAGTVGGDGAAVVVLKRLDDALRDKDRIYAVIKGSAINNDGSNKVGYTAPGVEGQSSVIRSALTAAQVDSSTISYIETHGTGTSLGDPIEVQALKRVYGNGKKEYPIKLGSIKTNIGHLNAAAGAAGLIKTALALYHGKIPASLNYTKANPNLGIEESPFEVITALTDWSSPGKIRRAGVSSFGIGGTNAHVILEETAKSEKKIESTRPFNVFMLSARTSREADAASIRLSEHLANNESLNPVDVSYTLAFGRKPFEHRRVVVAGTLHEASQLLRSENLSKGKSSLKSPLVFMFPGQGSQYQRMAMGLYRQEQVFHSELDKILTDAQKQSGVDYLSLLFSENSTEKELRSTDSAQVIIFAIEYSLAKLLMSRGAHPDYMIGHSLGEYTAAALSGVFELHDAIRLIVERGKLMSAMAPGSMLSVKMGEQELRAELPSTLDIAAVNAPTQCVVSGPSSLVAELEKKLTVKGIITSILNTSHAFHSSMMEPMLGQFSELVRSIPIKEPTIPYVSNLTGRVITVDDLNDKDYWIKHLRNTVRFADGISSLAGIPSAVFCEVGPGKTLAALTRSCFKPEEAPVIITTIRQPNDSAHDVRFLLEAVGRLWCNGIDIAWSSFFDKNAGQRLSLPTYPFTREKYWMEETPRGERKHLENKTVIQEKASDNEEDKDQNTDDRNTSELVDLSKTTLVEVIRDIWKKVLGKESIGPNDSFWDLGGDSLIAHQVMIEIEQRTAIKVTMQIVYENQTVEELAKAVEQCPYMPPQSKGDARVTEVALDVLQADSCLDADIRPSQPYDASASVSSVFVTGSTGFVGAFLLSELINQTDGILHCLVRARSVEEGTKRIHDNIRKYLGDVSIPTGRIVPVIGDLSKPQFGLTREVYTELTHSIDSIFHIGALVNVTYPYSILKAPNVLGTKEIIKLACADKTKAIHFVSTLALFSNPSFTGIRFASESSHLKYSLDPPTGYSQTKLVAELLLQEARKRGVPVNVYRGGRIGGDSKTGKCQTDDFLWRLIKGCIQLGEYPVFNTPIEFYPVDYFARFIVKLSDNKSAKNKVFHFFHPNPMPLTKVLEWMRSYGYNLRVTTMPQWFTNLKDHLKMTPDNSLFPLVPLVTRVGAARFHLSKYIFTNTNLKKLLGKDFYTLPSIDGALLTTYFDYFVNTGFLKKPESSEKKESLNNNER
jgi:phthiocerol/phenolphthiocerol synthesis type-I polyketide synthase E